MARVTGHALEREGAPYDERGMVIARGGYVTTSGDGRARCQCGELSEWLPSGGARRAWHKVHKAQMQHVGGKP